jgi:pimeloyl-ACP methyl ester carboxylesterase
MPTIEINGANIYYQAYGDDHPNHPPIVLIHGSTIDSHTDWDSIAPELALHYKVFSPDCRGHGRSNNPTMSYSFKELADDVAAFVRAMRVERAHIIGHSNGGNVALVTLMEYPEVVQTCIPQAANAYVTRYLIEREPKVFDPDRVAREAPQWRDEMIKLHSEVNGKEYWRELLWLTMKEIISEPNYSPAELARVEKPTLVIMGAEDTVNAPDEHAQYIANNIPNAELWIPEKTGHNVHLERPEEWLAKVLDFLERRGSGN